MHHQFSASNSRNTDNYKHTLKAISFNFCAATKGRWKERRLRKKHEWKGKEWRRKHWTMIYWFVVQFILLLSLHRQVYCARNFLRTVAGTSVGTWWGRLIDNCWNEWNVMWVWKENWTKLVEQKMLFVDVLGFESQKTLRQLWHRYVFFSLISDFSPSLKAWKTIYVAMKNFLEFWMISNQKYFHLLNGTKIHKIQFQGIPKFFWCCCLLLPIRLTQNSFYCTTHCIGIFFIYIFNYKRQRNEWIAGKSLIRLISCCFVFYYSRVNNSSASERFIEL